MTPKKNHDNANTSNAAVSFSLPAVAEYFSLPAVAEPSTTALVVVDVQPESWTDWPEVQKDFPEFPKNLRNTVEICRERNTKIIWVRADYRPGQSPILRRFKQSRGVCNRGQVLHDSPSPTFGWEDFARPKDNEVIIVKPSLSSTTNTSLLDTLKTFGIDTVLVCGLITSVSVQHSAYGIFEAGYRTVVVEDACADRGKARHEAALSLYGDYMYEVVTSGDLPWIVGLDESGNSLPIDCFAMKHLDDDSSDASTATTESSHTNNSMRF
mmetsp:Transcript_20786/g.57711  ORF Transcript_20786/g.57711 Transcript_20786/m.57711 type:complete len:268 (-) Transcript_20786:249-1052(-)